MLYYSTQLALILKVQNVLLSSLDTKSVEYLALIDLSAALNTVSYTILLDFLQDTIIGIYGNAWNWFQCSLSGQTQQVSV